MVSDDQEGFKTAVPGPPPQEPPRHTAGVQGAGGRELRAILGAPAGEQTFRIASSEAKKKWRKKGNEKVAEHVEEHIEVCLSCLTFPESHRGRIRTTNVLQRLNQGIRGGVWWWGSFQPKGVPALGERLGGRVVARMDHGEA